MRCTGLDRMTDMTDIKLVRYLFNMQNTCIYLYLRIVKFINSDIVDLYLVTSTVLDYCD